MNLLSPAEIMELYIGVGSKKSVRPASSLVALGALAGFIIGASGAAAATVSHAITNPSLARLISGLIFPFGLGIVLLLGAELFTGNSMMFIAAAAKRASVRGILRNWLCVYLGNFVGAAALAAACAFTGPLDHGGEALALHTIRVAAAKCTLPFGSALVLGILCNLLVCMGVLCGMASKDLAGRVMGAFLPVSFFVFGGFEHCVANMYIVPAGLFARLVPRYEIAAQAAEIGLSQLTWGRFIAANLLPVTIGNILGGLLISFLMWRCHVTAEKST